MSNDPIGRLISLFERFPGIGPRQAQRFVLFLLRNSPSTRRDLVNAIQELETSVRQCPTCMRFHSGNRPTCSLCANTDRDASLLVIVASDTDLAAFERSGTYRGRYFVLGGTIHLATEKKEMGLRVQELLDSISRRIDAGLREIIFAFPANPEGDATASYLRDRITEITPPSLAITSLGRGLSTGSELEYADPDTLRAAFDSRR